VGLLLVATLAYRVALTVAGVMQVQDLSWALIGAVLSVAFFGALWWFTKGRGMGLGDVKLAAPMAFLLGWPNIIVGILVAFVSGAVVGIGLLLAGKKKFGQVIPFGPFLVWGTVITLIWGDALYYWYISLL
jgi:leader peptidase (prepilin peptidase) / N-methyltransferase